MSSMRPRLRSSALAIALAAGACLAVSAVPANDAGATAPAPVAVGSARQVYLTNVAPSTQLALVNSSNQVVATQRVGSLGAALFRNVAPGTGYRVRRVSDGVFSKPVTVHSNAAAQWNPSIYKQTISDNGYQYLTTRDGTKLAIDVHPPTSPAGEPGLPAGTPVPNGPAFAPPYPTLIEYSGYGYANPAGPTNGIAILANLMGFAVVDVNMRGTGCSGGAFDFFEPLQSLDGYDVIETIAHQSWVANGKVGMIGISYGGISQLFTAAQQPPDLAAIAPLSVIDATATTLYPGGNLNTGFAVAWAQQRQDEAKPAGPNTGQPYAWQQIQSGDTTCAANQALHTQAADLMAKIRANSHYSAPVADPLDPDTFVHKINVPVFMACQFEDEQTGGHCPELVRNFTGTTKKWFTFTNGAHIDSIDPDTYNRWYDFLQLYVAKQAPAQNVAITRAAAPVIYQQAMGLPSSDSVTLPTDSIQTMPTYAGALAAFERLPMVRVLFDNGAGQSPTMNAAAGDPYAGFAQNFSALPVPGTVARTWYLGAGGTLGSAAPATAGSSAFTWDANALPLTDFGTNTGSGGLWGNASQWSWNWQQNPAGSAVSYVSSPLAANTTVVGGGAVYLWVKSSTPDVDLQATISEVRPDGKETFVQNGWLRASERKLSTDTNNMFKRLSTTLEPVPTFTAADASPMPAGQYVSVAIPLYYEGHAYRAGSRIRVTIAAPNGTQPIWAFGETVPTGTATVSIAFSQSMPSSLVLPVVPGVSVPTALPACPSLRNEPCRTYQAITNSPN
jgi:predicted acyl esterase